MATNTRIKVSDLDFNQIRENLKNFMRGQDVFTDYDFDGSALSTLIDVLAYNTHYNALYTNLAVNEMFLDSASKRASLVSIANNFGYTPRSITTARAMLNVVNTDLASAEQSKVIPRLSSFNATIDGKTYVYWTLKDYTALKTGQVYTFNDVEIYEGTPQTQLYVCTEANQTFTIPHSVVDLDTMLVTVQKTGEAADYKKYVRATEVLELTAESEVYFIKEMDDGTYQLSFGSNNIGKSLAIGNVITVSYLLSSGVDGNGASIFNFTGNSIGGIMSLTTTSVAYGGKDRETNDEIRSNVSQSFFDQNRAVTPNDYKAIIVREYPNVDSINIWGGENNLPPVYGKVFISIKPNNSLYLTPTEKSYIKENILRSKNVVSVIPEIIDPSYIEMEINTSVYYNKNKLAVSIDQLKAATLNGINTYADTYLNKFDGMFKMSKFGTWIDSLDEAITSSITTFTLNIEQTPKYNVYAEYALNLGNPVYNEGVPEEAFYSTGFYIDDTTNVYHLDDDGQGNIRLIQKDVASSVKTIVNPTIGTINYNKGIIKISNLRITNLDEPNLYFTIKTSSYDVVSVRNQIVTIPSSRITVNAVEDTMASGTNLGGMNYTFTTSRN